MSDHEGDDLRISVVMREYDTLRAEILARIRSRFELLTVGGAGVGFLLKTHHPNYWLVAGAVAAVLALHTYFGWTLTRLSGRVAVIETKVSNMLGDPDLLRWERRDASRLIRWWNERRGPWTD